MNKVNYDELTQQLVLIMLGVKLENFKKIDQDQMVNECLAIYKQYVIEYFNNHYPEVDFNLINHLDFIDAKNQNITIGIAQKIQTAYQSFIENLEQSWASV